MNDWSELTIAFITGVFGPLSVIFVKNYLDKNAAKIVIVIIALILIGYGIYNSGLKLGDWLYNQVNVSEPLK